MEPQRLERAQLTQRLWCFRWHLPMNIQSLKFRRGCRLFPDREVSGFSWQPSSQRHWSCTASECLERPTFSASKWLKVILFSSRYWLFDANWNRTFMIHGFWDLNADCIGADFWILLRVCRSPGWGVPAGARTRTGVGGARGSRLSPVGSQTELYKIFYLQENYKKLCVTELLVKFLPDSTAFYCPQKTNAEKRILPTLLLSQSLETSILSEEDLSDLTRRIKSPCAFVFWRTTRSQLRLITSRFNIPEVAGRNQGFFGKACVSNRLLSNEAFPKQNSRPIPLHSKE